MKQDDLREAGEKLYEELQQAVSKCCSTIATSARVKFKDADLIGIPYRITIGKKSLTAWLSCSIGAQRRARMLNHGRRRCTCKA
jgi:prolyl-tRNA synthetase